MKTMTELREAFATGWATGTSHEIIQLLRDPTPITEAGLRELGFHLAKTVKYSIFAMTGVTAFIDEHGFCDVDTENGSGYIKTMGQLRGLLLFVGE